MLNPFKPHAHPAIPGCPRSFFAFVALLFFGVANPPLSAGSPEPAVKVRQADGDYVVFLHGFSVFNKSLGTMARRVNEAGFETVDISYPSRNTSPESVVANYLRPSVEKYCTDPKRKIHFVGYSMGSVFTHRFLEESPPKNLGRVVLLAGPHQGVKLMDIAREKLSFLAKPFGEAANRFGTGENAFPQTLNPPKFAPGVIMGRRSSFPFFSPMIPGPDDGIVPVNGGKIPEAADFIVIDSSHTEMQRSKAASTLVLDFIRLGRFDHSKDYRSERPRPKITTRKRRHF